MNTPAMFLDQADAEGPRLSGQRRGRADRKHPIVQMMPTIVGLIACCGACAATMAVFGRQAGAAAFAVFVVTLSVLQPGLVFVLALLLSPYNADIQTGLPVKVAASDLCLFLAMPFILARRGRDFARALRAPYWVPVFAYLGLCLLSTILSGLDREALVSTSQMFIYMVFTVAVFAAGAGSAPEFLPRLHVVGVANLIVAASLLVGRSNFVLGLHKNAAGSTLAAGGLIMLGLWFAEQANTGKSRRGTFLVLITLLGGLLVSLSRGSWLGMLLGAAVLFLFYGRVKQALKLCVASIPILAILWVMLPDEQRTYATDFSASAHNVKARVLMIEYALRRFRESPIVGVGVGLRKDYDATNVALATLAETGIIGIALFGACYVTIAAMAIGASKRLNRADPAFALLAIGSALVLAKLAHGMVDHYWVRGAIVYWAGAGMVVAAYVQSRTSRSSWSPA